jgi:hypothetical protein
MFDIGMSRDMGGTLGRTLALDCRDGDLLALATEPGARGPTSQLLPIRPYYNT